MTSDHAKIRLVIGPNASLSRRGAWFVLGVLGGVLALISGVCIWHGFWPVAPFAGLELAALGAALWVTQRRNAYREVISFDDRQVTIEFGFVGRGAASRVELTRFWTRVHLEEGARRNEPNRLVLSSSGQRVIVARCLIDEEREALYRRIRGLLTQPTVDSTQPDIEPAGMS